MDNCLQVENFFHSAISMSFHSFLAWSILYGRSGMIFIFFPLYIRPLLPYCFKKSISLFVFWITICLGDVLFGSILFVILLLLYLCSCFFPESREVLCYYLSHYFFPFPLFLSFWYFHNFCTIRFNFPLQKCVLWSKYHLELKSKCRGAEHLKIMCILRSDASYRVKNASVLVFLLSSFIKYLTFFSHPFVYLFSFNAFINATL